MQRKKLLFLMLLLLAIPLTIGIALQRQELRQQAATATNTTVDFTQKITDLAPYAFSSTISTYGNEGTIVTSTKQRSNLSKLNLALYRIPLRWVGGTKMTTSSAGGTNGGGPSGDEWIANIRALGATPMIVIGGSADNNFTPTDAANLVDHFNGTNGTKSTKVTYWIIGNEPDNQSTPMSTTCDLFNRTYDAMKAVDPTIKIGGPALASYEVGSGKANEYREFLQCSGSRVDIIDFHAYGQSSQDLDDNVAQSAEIYAAKIADLRKSIQQIVSSRANQIEIQVGEYNVSPFANGDADPRFYGGGTTVWGALAAGNIAKAGARGHQYSDQNNPLGLTFENQSVASQFGKTVADPLPIYHGLGMFTGEGLFRTFGTQMVQATTSLPNVTIYASTNEKNIVMINKSPTTTQTASIQLTGFTSGTVDIWQTNKDKPFDPPVKKITFTIANAIEYSLPPYSVTTFVLTPSEGQEPFTGSGPSATTVPTQTPVPSATPTARPASPTPVPPTVTPRVSTPTPTTSVTPSASSGQAPSISTTNIQITLSLFLHGIGKGGDNVNTNSAGNSNPLRKQRTATLSLYNPTNQLVASKQAPITFDAASGTYTGTFDFTAIPQGYYTMKLQADHYLRKAIQGIHLLKPGMAITLPSARLITGDITKDNTINIMDYNVLIGCYSDLLPAVNCSTDNKVSSDISDDGKTNAVDYNLFLRELTQIQGE